LTDGKRKKEKEKKKKQHIPLKKKKKKKKRKKEKSKKEEKKEEKRKYPFSILLCSASEGTLGCRTSNTSIRFLIYSSFAIETARRNHFATKKHSLLPCLNIYEALVRQNDN